MVPKALGDMCAFLGSLFLSCGWCDENKPGAEVEKCPAHSRSRPLKDSDAESHASHTEEYKQVYGLKQAYN